MEKVRNSESHYYQALFITLLVFAVFIPTLLFAQCESSVTLEKQVARISSTEQILSEIESAWNGPMDFSFVKNNFNKKIILAKANFFKNNKCNSFTDEEILSFKKKLINRLINSVQIEDSLTLLQSNEHPVPETKQINGPCVNMDFETCDYTGWTMTKGNVDSNPYGYINVTSTTSFQTGYPATSGPDQHFIVNGGTDPIVGFPMVGPSGICTALLGNGNNSGYGAASMNQTFMVSPANANYTYQYAVVLENPSGHSVGEMPFFKINMTDGSGNSIACANYEVYAGNGDPNWLHSGSIDYMPWTSAFIPLQAYIGQNVTIEFITGDCGQGAHYGYAYIDASCSVMDIIPSDTIVCPGMPVTLTAPSGAASYLWSTGETTQVISVTTGGTYSVAITAVTGCVVNLNVTVVDGTAPVASFFNDTVCFGSATTFTDLSSGPNSIIAWSWDFNGDGLTDNVLQNPNYVFPTSATVPVTLEVTDGSGCKDDTTINVPVYPQPTANFSANEVCEGTVTQYTDLSTITSGAITSWDWDFDSNGSIDNTSQNPSNGFSVAGTYNTTLSLSTMQGCTSSVTLPVIVNAMPIAAFSQIDVCLGNTMNFTDNSVINTGSITAWQWDMGDLSGTSVQQSPSYTYGTSGIFNAQLTVTSSSGCIGTITQPVDVFDLPVAAYTVTDVCLNAYAQFTDNSSIPTGLITNWDWDVIGNGITDYTTTNPSNLYSSANTYTTSLIVTSNNGCKDTATLPITIFPMPTANFGYNNVCIGSAVNFTDNSSVATGTITNWSWNFDDGNSSTLTAPSNNYLNEGLYNVSLIVTSDNGCTDTIVQNIEVWPLPIVDFIPTIVCFNTPTVFTDISTVSNSYTSNTITQWNWNFDDGTTSNLASPTNTFSTDGVYNTTLIVVTNHGCVDSITQAVTVFPNPTVSFTSTDPSGCSIWCVDFTNGSAINTGAIQSYLWDFGDGTSGTDINPSHCYTNSTQGLLNFTISLVATSDQGCVSDSTAYNMISVYPIPEAEFSYNPIELDEYHPDVDFTNLSIGAATWSWNFDDGDSSFTQNPAHSYPNAGTYMVNLFITNSYGCTSEITHPVLVKPEYNIFVPNAFTPDGDGINDIFYAEGFNIIEFKLYIFNRWGQLIFTSNNMDIGWDGNYKGRLVLNDVYVWKVNAIDIFHERHEFYGHVTVVR